MLTIDSIVDAFSSTLRVIQAFFYYEANKTIPQSCSSISIGLGVFCRFDTSACTGSRSCVVFDAAYFGHCNGRDGLQKQDKLFQAKFQVM
jgi:hypothetical protein